ncbi:MAG: YchJ family protein [Desulforhopalus sp.]
MNSRSPCPCSGGLPYADCCRPVLDNHSAAISAEMLMRSRYTAFVVGNVDHVMTTWHPGSRPEKIDLPSGRMKWLGLEIHEAEGGQGDATGSVDFTATFLENGQLCRLREQSCFIKQDNLWYYQRGTCTVERTAVARKAPCPCGSGKRFKRCCAAG